MTDRNEKPKPAPLETEPSKQMDGRKQDGSNQEQSGKVKPSKPRTSLGFG